MNTQGIKKLTMIEFSFTIECFVFVMQPGGIICFMTSHPCSSVTRLPHTHFYTCGIPQAGTTLTHTHTQTQTEKTSESRHDCD